MAENAHTSQDAWKSRVDFSSDEVGVPEAVRRGRGARSNLSGRFETLAKTPFDDGWQSLEDLPRFKTQVTDEAAKKIITR